MKKQELVQANHAQKSELNQELHKQLQEEKAKKEEYKQFVRDAHKNSPGFNFEYYEY
jgi:hypothetical protein